MSAFVDFSHKSRAFSCALSVDDDRLSDLIDSSNFRPRAGRGFERFISHFSSGVPLALTFSGTDASLEVNCRIEYQD